MSAVSHRPAGLAALRRRLTALPAAARAAVAPAFEAVAEEAVADVRAALGPAAAVSADPTPGGSAVTVAGPAAHDLEYGTLHGTARPVLRPAALRVGAAAPARLGAALRRGLTP